MANMSIRIILNSGKEFTVKCNEFTIKRDCLGKISSYEINGISENKPVYLDFEQIAAIVRVASDEGGAAE